MKPKVYIETSIPSFYYEARTELIWWRGGSGHENGGAMQVITMCL
ncbi:hypothetical protein [Nostoc sp. CALU 546]